MLFMNKIMLPTNFVKTTIEIKRTNKKNKKQRNT